MYPVARRLAATVMAAVLTAGTGCADLNPKKKEDDEAARNTFACRLDGERLVIKLDAGEARLLLPGGERVILYQIPTASGVRYSNGYFELRGKGLDLVLIRDGGTSRIEACEPYRPEKPAA